MHAHKPKCAFVNHWIW